MCSCSHSYSREAVKLLTNKADEAVSEGYDCLRMIEKWPTLTMNCVSFVAVNRSRGSLIWSIRPSLRKLKKPNICYSKWSETHLPSPILHNGLVDYHNFFTWSYSREELDPALYAALKLWALWPTRFENWKGELWITHNIDSAFPAIYGFWNKSKIHGPSDS